MTCEEFKRRLFRAQGPDCPSEVSEAVEVHAVSCQSCADILKGLLERFVRKDFERVYGDPYGPDVPADAMPLPEPDHDTGRGLPLD